MRMRDMAGWVLCKEACAHLHCGDALRGLDVHAIQALQAGERGHYEGPEAVQIRARIA